MQRDQFILDFNPLVVDLFAGGGGMSEAIELALNRHADLALNHSADAISMHEANHPQSRHLIADVREVCPYHATNGRDVAYLHMSPDCRDHSQAKGGQPRDRKIRALSWVGVHWAGTVRPQVISIECVKQLLAWSPMIAKRDKATGRVVKLDGSVAAKGEHVPLEKQFLVPDPKRKGKTWDRFVAILRGMGYVVDWKVSRACDFGAPTTRERLMVIARCDGKPIVWPAPTHSKDGADGTQRYRTAADCIDFTLPSKSIFNRKKDLAGPTLRRIAVGIDREVLRHANPFVVPVSGKMDRESAPLTPHAVDADQSRDTAIGSPVLVQVGYGERDGQAPRALNIRQPLGTVVAGGAKHAVATAYLAQMNGGFNDLRGVPGHDLRRPISSITRKGSQQQLITASLAHLRGNCDARSVRDPLQTISAAGQHHAVVQCVLSPELEAGARRVATFLKEHGIDLPATHDTLAGMNDGEVATVVIDGITYVIVDILLRMLSSAELFSCQGFPQNYILERGHDGREFSQSKQIHMCGNSVSPPWAAAFLRANLPHLTLPGKGPKGTRRPNQPTGRATSVQQGLLDRVAA
ncbi:DNA cytosine methyltransferase [Paraburkholderia sp. SIMBA_054]|uniref:DNA cytosine methyltransferase n=1 Tax=Paraburkholderia sp. SIMBA_054 TaxID=3085795 RepID=UPI0039793D64